MSFEFKDDSDYAELVKTLKEIDPNSISPKDALDTLYILKEMTKR